MSTDGNLLRIYRDHLQGHWQSLEIIGSGVPDANYCLCGADGWVEFKKVYGWQIKMAPVQVAWAEQRLRAGGRVFLACRKGAAMWLFHGSSARFVRAGGVLAAEPILRGLGGPARWPWEDIRRVLEGREKIRKSAS